MFASAAIAAPGCGRRLYPERHALAPASPSNRRARAPCEDGGPMSRHEMPVSQSTRVDRESPTGRSSERSDDSGPLPRHPIVLVHGLLGFVRRAVTRLLSYAYFQGVSESLAEDGIPVRTVALPPSASVESRARALADAIEGLGLASTDRVNLVAHSMGGLDARWYVG